MATNIERRIQALESDVGRNRSAAEMTDRELLYIVAPDYHGAMPTDSELPGFLESYLIKEKSDVSQS